MTRGRFDGLLVFLAGRDDPTVELTFAELDGLIGGGLPESARSHLAWWANRRTGQPHARFWLDSGREALPDLVSGRVIFARVPGAENRFRNQPIPPSPHGGTRMATGRVGWTGTTGRRPRAASTGAEPGPTHRAAAQQSSRPAAGRERPQDDPPGGPRRSTPALTVPVSELTSIGGQAGGWLRYEWLSAGALALTRPETVVAPLLPASPGVFRLALAGHRDEQRSLVGSAPDLTRLLSALADDPDGALDAVIRVLADNGTVTVAIVLKASFRDRLLDLTDTMHRQLVTTATMIDLGDMARAVRSP